MILSIDQGTSSTKCLILDENGKVLTNIKANVFTNYQNSGFVEQDATKIWESVINCILQLKNYLKFVKTVAISNQRESILAWSKSSGEPLSPVITWQDRRAEPLIRSLESNSNLIQQISGLNLDPMYSAGKISWIVNELVRNQKVSKSDIAIGTIDSWLLWKFGAGHFIEISNASRTQLLDIEKGSWSDNLIDIFDLEMQYLPEVKSSNHKYKIKTNSEEISELNDCTISAILGDSHSALFAHRGWLGGIFKATYGTGTSVMGLNQNQKVVNGISKTIAWQIDQDIKFAHEANILSSGSTLTWLAKLFNMDVNDFIELAKNSKENINLLPSFDGLGAPWWIKNSKASISNLALSTSISDISYAGLKSVALQIYDVIDLIKKFGIHVNSLLADGEGSKNDFLMQLQADFLQIPVKSSKVSELSALGVAYIAGIDLKYFNYEDLKNFPMGYREFQPSQKSSKISDELNLWRNSLESVINHE